MSGAGPSLHLVQPPSWAALIFPPDPAPSAIPPPVEYSTWRSLFPISAGRYNALLSAYVPLAIATVYVATVFCVNSWNRKHGNEPGPISKTRAFRTFVVIYNFLLAVYSAFTCFAMIRALKRSIPHYTERNALVGTVDALCKLHGPRGFGDAVTYHPSAHRWESKNSLINLDAFGLPDSTDVGRIWNEGLAWWGWWFYLSKFYEVVDTFITIMKGKRSTTLQTYHHAGAMLSMWSGIRYMSPPIWMFTLVNSGIHAMMYTYYTLSALSFRVPEALKRILTGMQIMQFVIGALFAACHLFVSYTVPVSVAYQVSEKILPNLNTAPIATAASPDTSSVALPSATVAVAFLKKLIYRAAGDEGLAENVLKLGGSSPVNTGLNQSQQPIRDTVNHTIYRTIYRTEYQHVPCLDTSGQAFAIGLNLIYLAPLFVLFSRFFYKSYIKRASSNLKQRVHNMDIAKPTRDAAKGVGRKIESLGESAEDGVSTPVNHGASALRGRKAQHTPENRHGSLSPENKKMADSIESRVRQELKRVGEDHEESITRAKQIAEVVDNVGSPKSDLTNSGLTKIDLTESDLAKSDMTESDLTKSHDVDDSLDKIS